TSTDPMLRREGLLLGAGILIGTLLGAIALALVVRAPKETLALAAPRPLAVVVVTVAGLALMFAFDGLAFVLNRPAVSQSWLAVYRSGSPALLGVALVLTSIFEELFFRGFLYTGIAKTRVGPIGAIAITSGLFSLAHLPEDGFRFFDVLLSGVLLGVARWRTGSTIPGMVPHVLGNLKVLANLAYVAGAFG
ncbi:MAG: lysostaphin resistance A-like protein, partial [Sandaracinaceae bacterium]